MGERPGQALRRRPLHFIWIADCSGSMMADGKIQALNNAIRETIPHLRDVAAQNPFAELLVRAVSFATDVRWHIPAPVPVEELVWPDLGAGGHTRMGSALGAVAEALKVPPMEPRSLRPALVLISDGQPTDDFDAGLRHLMDQRWGQNAVRLAVAIGRDADQRVLERFIGNPEIRPALAHNPEQLTQFIRWASTAASRVASTPRPVPAAEGMSRPRVPVPGPPTFNGPDPLGLTW